MRWTLALCCLAFCVAVGTTWAASPPAAPAPDVREPAGGAWLGVWLVDAVDGGAQIVAVVRGGPAGRSGLTAGDVIVEADGRSVVDQEDLARWLSDLTPGSPLVLTVLREGQSLNTNVRVGRRPAPGAPPPAAALPRVAPAPGSRAASILYRLQSDAAADPAGLRVADVTPVLREHFGAPRESGVLVVGVDPGRIAARAGIEVGDVLVRLDGEAIDNRQDLEQALRERTWSEPAQAFVVRNGEGRTFTLPVVDASAVAEGGGPRSAEAEERKLVERRLEIELERLERRLAEVREELERLRERD